MPTRQDADAIFDQLDKGHKGAITREQFDDWMRHRDQKPVPQTMTNAPYPGAVKTIAVVKDDLSEDARSMKDIRRAFALAGPLLIIILAFVPVIQALSLMRSTTYIYFCGWGSPIGGMLMVTCIFVAWWMSSVMGVGCPGCPMPNPFRVFEPLWNRMRLVPTEAYIITATIIVLMLVWKILPKIAVGGIQAVVDMVGSVADVFEFMWFSNTPAGTVLACALTALVLYVLSLNYFFARAKPEARSTAASLFAIWAVFVLLMGVSFMLLSMPISYEADKANNEMMLACETGPRTRDLFVTSQALQALRQDATCAKYLSIEDCEGYQNTPFSRILKSMEADYKCAGFCHNPALLVPLGGAQPKFSPSMIDSYQYPPTLFSLANYQASCDGMAARNMQHYVGVVGAQVFNQGVICVITALVMALMFMVSICGGYREKDTYFAPDGYTAYGSTS